MRSLSRWSRLRRAIEDRLLTPPPHLSWWNLMMALPSAMYGEASAAHIRRQESRSARVGVPVVSIGALSVGGVGKTPCARHVAELIATLGVRPAVVCGGRAPDEELLLTDWLSGIAWVTADRHRQRAARCAIRSGAGAIVLDDGFQYASLCRDLDIVCVNPDDPLEGARVLPSGPLREPPRGLDRADVLWANLTPDATTAEEVAAARSRMAGVAPGASVVVARIRASVTPAMAPGTPVLLCTGVARPERVRATATAIGLDVRGALFVPDHADLDIADAEALDQRARQVGADRVVITEKDAWRPGFAAGMPPRLRAVLRIRLEIACGEAALRQALQDILGGGTSGP